MKHMNSNNFQNNKQINLKKVDSTSFTESIFKKLEIYIKKTKILFLIYKKLAKKDLI